MLSFFRSTAAAFRQSRSLLANSKPYLRQERLLIVVQRKQRLNEIVRCVQGTAQRFTSRINHATDMEQLDLVQSDLFTFLARDRGETYAQGVIFGDAEAQPSGHVPLNETPD